MPEASVYSATKAAVDHMTRILAKEYGSKGVRVNAVAPGLTATDMTKGIREQKELLDFWENQSPFGRIGQPDEVAAVVAFLATEDAQWVTGQIIQAGGGAML
jgi:NAD(P)-dependent dehydrogenase (short-subunit alcohol dehydrogenase family)